jgi:stress response protein SCP2
MTPGMGIALRPGEAILIESLDPSLLHGGLMVQVSASAGVPDIITLVLGDDGRVRNDDDLVFSNNPRSIDGSVSHLGQRSAAGLEYDAVMIVPSKVDATVGKIVVGCSGGMLDVPGGSGDLSMVLTTAQGQLVATAPLTSARDGGAGAVIVWELYRRNGEWRCRLLDQAYRAGLAAFVTDFGVAVEEGSAASPPTMLPASVPSPPPPPLPLPAVGAQTPLPPAWPDPASGQTPPQRFAPTLPPMPQVRTARGLFTSRRRQQLESENAALQQVLAATGALDNAGIAAQRQSLVEDIARLAGEADRKRAEIAALEEQARHARRDLVAVEADMALQEIGIYEFHHRLDDSIAYKAHIAMLRDQIKAAASGGRAVTAISTWMVNNSAAEGARMVKEFSKLMLRAYNSEADDTVRRLRPYTIAAALVRLDKSRETVARLGRTMQIRVSDEYHHLRREELKLTADYLQKAEEEKERQREARERQREETKAAQEFAREQERLVRDQQRYEESIQRLVERGDTAGAEELRAKLAQVVSAIGGLAERASNLRMGHVYVISNLGAFGERMVKIGMTRRMDPMDRVRELGDASVPFRFDVHALIFSEDAVDLETSLHRRFADRRVNRVNQHREFFYVTPAEVRTAVADLAGQHLVEYTDTAEAPEWRQSGGPERAILPT